MIAKIGYKVLAIEAFYDNILRIHKACYIEQTHNNLILIHNALSNKRNEIKMLQPFAENIGAQSLLPFNSQNFTRNKTNKYLVETILFDDIIPYLPLQHDSNKPFKKAILKIDIEGFEPFAFQHARQLFDTLDIIIVFMEWFNIKRLEANLVEPLIDFLVKRKYVVYSEQGQSLKITNWTKNGWTFNVEWRKQ